MNFHSVEFLAFLALVLPLFWCLANRRTARTLILLVASLYFYGSYELWYLWLIVFSTLLDYVCGNVIQRAAERGALATKRLGLIVSLVGNLGVLAFFKYTDWFVESAQVALDWCTAGAWALGVDFDLWALRTELLPSALLESNVGRILVPVGISFYTFQTLSYTIDVYRGTLRPARNLLDFALFVSFFPQLVAGPIVRAVDFLPQLELKPRFDRARLHEGLWRISTGLLKKIALADVLGAYLVDPCYTQPENYTALVHLLALYAFTLQIYFDFSGYSDIAIGTAKLFGFDLIENFLLPYRSRSLREFWRRWHISLSSWVRDYIYFPLGGSRGSQGRVAANLLVTMLVIGVWHGASLLWVAYGLMQGLVMVAERACERRRGGALFATTPLSSFVSWFATFHFIVFSCLFIRSRSVAELVGMTTSFGEGGLDQVPTWAYWALVGGALTHFWPRAITEAFHRAMLRMPTPLAGFTAGLAAGAVAVLVVGDTPYIYFQF